jgi:hypothetical protein
MHTSEYLQLRDRFVQLCLTGLRQSLIDERTIDAAHDFDIFCADWRVQNVAIKGSSFYFTTRRLAMATPNDGMRWVGEFLVSINVLTKEIACEGSEPKRKADETAVFYHPHVLNTKVPCFGQSSSVKFGDWFGDGKIAHVAFYVLEFLCLARGSSHYFQPDNWPALTPEEAKAWHFRQ